MGVGFKSDVVTATALQPTYNNAAVQDILKEPLASSWVESDSPATWRRGRKCQLAAAAED